MKSYATLTLILSVLAVVSAQSCIPRGSPHKWLSAGNNIHYARTERNVRWRNADAACRALLPGYSRLAEVRSVYEWQGMKAVVTPNWYWFNNKNVPKMENNARYFHFDARTRLFRQVRWDDYCLLYVYPGSGTTDLYCGMNWAHALCEVRC